MLPVQCVDGLRLDNLLSGDLLMFELLATCLISAGRRLLDNTIQGVIVIIGVVSTSAAEVAKDVSADLSSLECSIAVRSLQVVNVVVVIVRLLLHQDPRNVVMIDDELALFVSDVSV